VNIFMRVHRYWRPILVGTVVMPLLAVCALYVVLHLLIWYNYPHGERSGLDFTTTELLGYAEDHDGWYPRGGKTALESLQKLYPIYGPEGLAGLSGSESGTLKVLKEGRPLDSNVSSWVYWPGFRIEDGKDADNAVAIIWERDEGLFKTGERASGHAVGYAGGGCSQVSAQDWDAFLERQQDLRAKVLAARGEKLEPAP
jgi:hypothetical protein